MIQFIWNPKLRIILLSSLILLVVSFTLTNSNATDESLKDKVAKIENVRSQGSITDPGCPNGFWYTNFYKDECTGEGTHVKTCPKDFGTWSKDYDCMADSKYQKCPSPTQRGYHDELIPPGFGSDAYVTCIGPFIDKVNCPPGYRNMDDPNFCIGPRQS